MGEESSNILRRAWGKSLTPYSKSVLFNEDNLLSSQPTHLPYKVDNTDKLLMYVDLAFLKQYITELTPLFALYKLPTQVQFHLEIEKLRIYFEDIRVDSYDKIPFYNLRFVLKNNINYNFR